jgi:ribosomal protein S18 acetylase RimI-like enzyme
MRKIKILEATTQDAALIAQLSRQTFYDTFAAVNTREDMDKFLNEQFTDLLLRQEVEQQKGLFYLAYEGSEPVGYVKLKEGAPSGAFNNNTAMEIARLYAVQSHIGKGVGKALMQHCVELARQLKKQMLWLGVWEKNERAIAFYQQWGFEKFGEHEFVLGNDHQTDWLMKRDISW